MKRTTFVLAAGLALLSACGKDPVAPPASVQEGGIDLVQDFDVSTAAAIDGAGIGGSALPDSLRLTAEQKARIDSLHRAYQAAVRADLDSLKKIELAARAAYAAGKSRAEVQAIIAQADPILARLRAAFARLQAAIWSVYTPAQQAWINSHRPGVCRDSTPRLTEEQVAKIRALKAAFDASIQDELEVIRTVHAEARAAWAAGASTEEVRKILAKAESAMEAIRQAELRLKEAILDVLTPEQRQNRCILGGLTR
jgi:Spy/CpxP family protein refolding chaperone